MSRCPISTATASDASNASRALAPTVSAPSSTRSIVYDNAHSLHYRGRRLAHRNLPRIELTTVATPGDERQQWKAVLFHHAEHVDAIAHAARLHQQYSAVAAQPGAAQKRYALFLRGQRTGRMVSEA